MEMFLNIVPVLGIAALLFAALLAARGSRQNAGTDKMKEIAAAIGEGAQAFLTAEYKILIFFVIVLFVLIGFGIGNWVTAICFVVGALFSTLAGYFGCQRRRNEQSALNRIFRRGSNGNVRGRPWRSWSERHLYDH